MVMGKGRVIGKTLGRYSVESVLRQVDYLKLWWTVWPLAKQEAFTGAEKHGAGQLGIGWAGIERGGQF